MRAYRLGQTTSEETKEKLRAAGLRLVQSEEAGEKIRNAQLGRPLPRETRLRVMVFRLGENDPTKRQEILRRDWTTYLKLPYGDSRRELLALHHGFGIYQRHSSREIGSICDRSHNWVQNNLKRAAAGQLLPRGRPLEFRIPDESLKPLFKAVDQLNVRQLQKLGDFMYELDPQGVEIVGRLFGLGGRSPQSAPEINRQLFQATPGGEQRVRDLRQAVEACVYSQDQDENDSDQFREAQRRDWTTYFELPYGDSRRELLALHHGFGIYQRHSSREIAPICDMSYKWVRNNLKRAAAGQLLPRGRPLEFRIPDESLKPLFRDVDQLGIGQLQRLADLMYKFDPQEVAMAVRLFGLGGRSPQSTPEINRQLFQATPWGEQRIRGFKRAVETHVYSPRQPAELANGPTRWADIYRIESC